MAEQTFQLLVTGTLTAAALFLFGMVECQLRGWRLRRSEMRDLLKRKLFTRQSLAEPLRGYDSPELFHYDESVRQKTELRNDN